jgi:predicted metal-dependent enzyme (double-stranded beta helix superfamily)
MTSTLPDSHGLPRSEHHAHPTDVLTRLLRSGRPWAGQARFDPDRRWYSRVGEHDGYEVWLLSWLPGQGTDLHDHGDASGAFAVLTGALTELIVHGRGSGPTTEWVHWTTGEVRRFGSSHVHQIHNRTDAPAVSLHVYSPALTTMTRYSLRPQGLRAVGTDQAGVTW